MGALTFAALGIWIYLIAAHGKFWLSRPELAPVEHLHGPRVDIVVPARDEAEVIGPVIASLLAQDYAGSFAVTLVDDNSSDATAERAGQAQNLKVLHGAPKPEGWSGKMWALEQGVSAGDAPLVLLTDADIVHDPRHLSTLVACVERSQLAMASEMVRLNCSSLAERALVPAFVYFFQMLYPFAKVNDPRSRVAAAAGGTRAHSTRGLATYRRHRSDQRRADRRCVARTAVKGRGGARSILGHSGLATSIRPYPPLGISGA